MKAHIVLLIFLLVSSVSFSQHSLFSYEKYKFRNTEVRHCEKADTSEIFYKGVSVGYLVAEKIKMKKETKFDNFIINKNLELVALVYNELGQLGIKYFNPYKVVFVKGAQFDVAVQQMVEVDKALFPK